MQGGGDESRSGGRSEENYQNQPNVNKSQEPDMRQDVGKINGGQQPEQASSQVTTPSLVSIHFYDRPGGAGATGGPKPPKPAKPAQANNPSYRPSSSKNHQSNPPGWPSPAFAAATSVIRRLSATQQQQQLNRLHQQVQQHLRARQKSEAIKQRLVGGGEVHRKNSAPMTMSSHHLPRLAPKPPISRPYLNSAPACLYSGGTLNLNNLQPILISSVQNQQQQHQQQQPRKSSIGAIVHLPADNEAYSSTSINAKALCELLAKAPVIPFAEIQQPAPEPPSPQLDVLRLISEACDIRHQDSSDQIAAPVNTPVIRVDGGEHKENENVNTNTNDNQEIVAAAGEMPKRRSSSRLARRPSMDPSTSRKLPRKQSKLESSSPGLPNQQPDGSQPTSPRQISEQQARFFYTNGAPMRRILPKPPVMAKSPFILRNPSLK